MRLLLGYPQQREVTLYTGIPSIVLAYRYRHEKLTEEHSSEATQLLIKSLTMM